MKLIVLLSGPIASGKSSLAKYLAQKLQLGHFSTSSTIRRLLGDGTREELQVRGQALDHDRPEWLWEEMSAWMNSLVLDSVRAEYQVDLIRKRALERRARVVHIHLTASSEALRERFEGRGEASKYDAAKADTLESSIDTMASIADMVIDTSKCTKGDTQTLALAAIAERGAFDFNRNVDVLVGGQYGSEGKGHVVAHIANEYQALMRVGGPNAGHSVLYNGNHVSFYHLPSGVLHAPHAEIILGAGMNINIDVLEKEIALAAGLGVKVAHRLRIDRNVNIIRPGDIAAEKKLVESIGSTGQGVGVATAARIVERSIRDSSYSVGHLPPALAERVCDVQEVLGDAYKAGKSILLEGTQGTGLSLFHGAYPFVTSRDTTASGTMAEAGIPPGRVHKVIMVVRSNPIRVQSPAQGSSGPMGNEISWEDVSDKASVDAQVLREREKTTTTKRQRRVAAFDWELLRRSAQLNLPTDIALTFADYISPENTKARRYEQLTVETQQFINNVEVVANAPVSLVTTRLHERSIIDRRKW